MTMNINKYGEVLDIVKSDEVDARRAITYKQAMEVGLPVKDYEYKGLPLGAIKVQLDFKMWGKFDNLELFFTELDTGKKFKISVYRDKNDNNRFTDRAGAIDFSESYINGDLFSFEIATTAKGNFSLKSAKRLK